MKKKHILTGFWIFIISQFFCAPKAGEEKILTQVGDRTISVDEFLRRVELTVRPNAPAASQDEYRNILLNNLIVEKLFAMEADKNSDLHQVESFNAFIQGIQEQAMRDRLFNKEAFQKVELDSSELMKAYRLAAREYDVEFYTINKRAFSKQIEEEIKAHPDSAVSIFNRLWEGKSRPRHFVKYKDPDAQSIHEALFSEPLNPNTVLGPIKIDDVNSIIMKVVDYRTVPAIGQDAELRWHDVKEKLTLNRAATQWGQYIKGVMKGKAIEFEPGTFAKLADLFYALMQAPSPADKEAIYKKFWQTEEGLLTLDSIGSEDALLDLPFFTVDHKVWTVRDFRKALMSHPLVYRRTEFNNMHYREAFKLAVADMIRDQYLTQEAYKQKLDKDPEVRRTTGMWKDALIASKYRDQYIADAIQNSLVDSTDNNAKIKFYDDWVGSLKDKYKKNIKVNLKELSSIEVSRINLFAWQQNVPYQVTVPAFPFTMTDKNLDYAQPMKSK